PRGAGRISEVCRPQGRLLAERSGAALHERGAVALVRRAVLFVARMREAKSGGGASQIEWPVVLSPCPRGRFARPGYGTDQRKSPAEISAGLRSGRGSRANRSNQLQTSTRRKRHS